MQSGKALKQCGDGTPLAVCISYVIIWYMEKDVKFMDWTSKEIHVQTFLSQHSHTWRSGRWTILLLMQCIYCVHTWSAAAENGLHSICICSATYLKYLFIAKTVSCTLIAARVLRALRIWKFEHEFLACRRQKGNEVKAHSQLLAAICIRHIHRNCKRLLKTRNRIQRHFI